MSVALEPTQIYSFDDLADLEDETSSHEIIGGELIVSPGAGFDHQEVSSVLILLLKGYVRQHRLGSVLAAPFDIKFSPHNVVEPDILFISSERRHIIQRKYATAAPDLVIEILTDSSFRRDQVQKRALYAMGGVPEYWIVNPKDQSIAVFQLRDEQYQLVAPTNAGHAQSAVLPGFIVDPDEVFADIELDHL